MTRKYKPMAGARMNNEQAKRYGERLEYLLQKQSFLTPKIVLDDARAVDSPLHDFFDWDEKTAAENWRLEQARYLIRCIAVTIEGEKEQEIRGFYSVTPDDSMDTLSPSIFVSLDTVLTDDDKRRQVIAHALRELRSWSKRYRQYKELNVLVKVIDEFK